jgi:transcriptional regulator with XRE-family HTH domain
MKSAHPLQIRVKYLRRINSLSKEELAKKIGTTIHYYKQFESGIENLNEELIKKLSEFFNENLLDADSEIVIHPQGGEITPIKVEREHREFIYNFLNHFLKLKPSLRKQMIEMIKNISN